MFPFDDVIMVPEEDANGYKCVEVSYTELNTPIKRLVGKKVWFIRSLLLRTGWSVFVLFFFTKKGNNLE